MGRLVKKLPPVAALIDRRVGAVNTLPMNDDDQPRRRSDELAALVKQSLDPLSVDELGDRIAALEAEVARTKAHMAAVTAHKAAADAFFKKG